ncbi:ABC transporter permease [Paenibacillus filicis]|uniref:ABC transporter permease n=1 Tax=Paenibacillus filicis TaxID=669464 RepID=A0ABU9DL04_9BACL
MKKLLDYREAPIIFFTLAVGLVFSLLSASYLEPGNIGLILTQIATNAIVAIGMTMVILLGGIDLSVGSVLALVATSVGVFLNHGITPWLAALLGIGIGILCGAVNGFFIAYMNIPDIIATLATMYIFRGVAVGISGGTWMTNFPPSFKFFGQGSVMGIPFALIVAVALAVLFALILQYMRFGRRVYALGGNRSAARLSGMNTRRTKFTVYIYSGILAAVAAVIFASQVGSVQASTAGNNLSFEVMAAVLIGGGSIFGGVGTVLGTMFGVLLMGMIKNGLVLTQVSPFWINATTGLLILVAVIINTIQRVKESKKKEGDLV